jgi:hypothetical protein
MRLGKVVLVVSALLFSAPSAHSAEIGPGGSPSCQLKLEGTIEAGDSEKLHPAVMALYSSGFEGPLVNLCLNSLGGNYDEALNLILELLYSNISTVVDRGAECYSACAFVFLAGNVAKSTKDGEIEPNRTLDVGATLGFHAPYLNATGTGTDVAAATVENFRRGVDAIAKLLEIDRHELFPRGLLGQALQVRANELLYVDTIEKVGVWSIKLKGYKRPRELTSRMLDQACRSKDMWANFSHTVLGRPADDPVEPHGTRQSDFGEIRGTDDPIKLEHGRFRQVLDVFGPGYENNCIADVFADPKGELHLSLLMTPKTKKGPDPEWFGKEVVRNLNDPQALELISAPLWYVYPPDTAPMSLGRPAIEVRPSPP